MMKSEIQSPTGLTLNGVHHTAFPTWKPKSTVEFYRDALGLKVPHAIAAKGWGRKDEPHPDFLHFFFEAGEGSMIAFFYYVGTRPDLRFQPMDGYLGLSRHTAWMAHSLDDLAQWRVKIKAGGMKVTPIVEHETMSSIYFIDPNGYNLEIACQTRPIDDKDVIDANMTVDAMVETFGDDNTDNRTIHDMWRLKGEKVQHLMQQQDR
jgi:catechol 2,3-dioxygenase-like lactoylglutathione lyase family enzyme